MFAEQQANAKEFIYSQQMCHPETSSYVIRRIVLAEQYANAKELISSQQMCPPETSFFYSYTSIIL